MCIHTHAHVHTYIYVHPQIVQTLPDALPEIGDFASGQKRVGPASHWQKPTKASIDLTHSEQPMYSHLDPAAQARLDEGIVPATGQRKCKFLQNSYVGLHQPTMKKAKAAFLADGGRVELSDKRNTGSFGVPQESLDRIADPTGWLDDEVKLCVWVYVCVHMHM